MYCPKFVALFGLVVVGFMCLYPPYECIGVNSHDSFSLKDGHYWIFTPPKSQSYNSGHSAYVQEYRINADRLAGQLLITCIGFTSFAVALHTVQHNKQ